MLQKRSRVVWCQLIPVNAPTGGRTQIWPQASNGQNHRTSRHNLHRRFRQIIESAELKPWDDLFQTLRRSCETEWLQSAPHYAVAKWLGHGIKVSEKHYAMITDEVLNKVRNQTHTASKNCDPTSDPKSSGIDRKTSESWLPNAQQKTPSILRNEPQNTGFDGVARAGLNRRHTDFQSVALPTELSGLPNCHSCRNTSKAGIW